MQEDDLRSLAESVSNANRFGPDDQLGTLNYITGATRASALKLVKDFEIVPLGRPLVPRSGDGAVEVERFMTLGDRPDISAQDVLMVSPHGYGVTHLDAVGHSFFEGRVYNGRLARDVVSASGLAFGSVGAAAGGIVTRGVLLDVAAASGVRYLGAGAGVTSATLDACEQHQGIRVLPGDAIFVRVGLDLREAVEGPSDLREGVLPDVIGWLHERQVSVYSGDCIERQPSGYASIPVPLHQIGMAEMGLWFLDNPDVERLARECHARKRFEFCLVVAPLAADGATASPVNPLVLF